MKYALLIYSTPESRQELGPELGGAHDEGVADELPLTAVAPRAGRATG